MAWLRIDDQRCLHPKIGKLSDADYRALDALLSFVSRRSRASNLGGSFGRDDLQFAVYVTPTGPRHVTVRHVNSFVRHGLVDEAEEGWKVHDWDVYQPKDPTAADRMKRYRDRNTNRNGTVTVTDEGGYGQTVTRARGPVPSRSSIDETSGVDATSANHEHQQPTDFGEQPEPREDPPADLHEIFLKETSR